MFKIENNVPIPEGVRGSSKEKQALRDTLQNMTNNQSVFVANTILSENSIVDVLKEIRDITTDRKFVSKCQDSPVKGRRIWVKFY